MTQDTLIAETMQERAKRLEAYETPEWPIQAILNKELLTHSVFDPCTGFGVMADVAERFGYYVWVNDIYDWDGDLKGEEKNFLADDWPDGYLKNSSVIMNPPFKYACAFVDQSFRLGARKVICFQRFAWWESKTRREWWTRRMPNRIYICGDRASCWRFDIPSDKRGDNTPTPHAWYVWEQGHPQGTQISHIYKEDAR